MKNNLIKFLFIKIILTTLSIHSYANISTGDWKPQIVEKMFILPPKQLDRVLNNDFRSSSLYLNLKSADKKIQNRYTQIEELNKSIHEFSGEEKIELRHQVIVEKKEYIKDLNERLNIKRKHLITKKRFFENIKRKVLSNNNNKGTNYLTKFESSRNLALERSKKLDKKVSTIMLNNVSNNSKYFSEYQKTMIAMQKLENKIKDHPKFKENELLVSSKNKLEALNVYIDSLESELSVIDLKEKVLIKMAKLVALDAMKLSDDLQIDLSNNFENQDLNDPTDSIDLFLN